MNEKVFSRQLRKSLQREFGDQLFIYKTTGAIYQDPGIPDLLGCLNGTFFAIENKKLDKWPIRNPKKLLDLFEPNQIIKLNKIELANGNAYAGIYCQAAQSAILLKWKPIVVGAQLAGAIPVLPSNSPIFPINWFIHLSMKNWWDVSNFILI